MVRPRGATRGGANGRSYYKEAASSSAKNYSELNNKLLCLYMMVTLLSSISLSLVEEKKLQKRAKRKRILSYTLYSLRSSPPFLESRAACSRVASQQRKTKVISWASVLFFPYCFRRPRKKKREHTTYFLT